MEKYNKKKSAPEVPHVPDVVYITDVPDAPHVPVPDASVIPDMPVAFDLERSGGEDDSEIIQLGYVFGSKSGGSYILQKGKIDPYGSKMSHNI